jgi:LysR family hydrogen peroxide-inducible transcriptional activator
MGVIPTIAPFFLPRALPVLRERYPDLKLYLREETSGLACESLSRGQLDCVLMALPYACGDVSRAKLFDDSFYIAFHASEMRDPPESVPPDAIDANRLLLLEDGHCLKDQALAACNRPELRAEAAILGTSLHTLVQMVDNRLGLTLLPKMAVDAGILTGTHVEARPLRAPHASREIALVWRTSSPRAAEFELLARALVEAAGEDVRGRAGA